MTSRPVPTVADTLAALRRRRTSRFGAERGAGLRLVGSVRSQDATPVPASAVEDLTDTVVDRADTVVDRADTVIDLTDGATASPVVDEAATA